MRGIKLLKISSILLIISGIINFVLGLLNLTGSNALLSTIPLGRVNMFFYCIQGVVAILTGIVAALYKSDRSRVKLVMACAWLVLVVTFIYFFLSYGYNWGIVLYELVTVIFAILYFWGAKRNVESAGKETRTDGGK